MHNCGNEKESLLENHSGQCGYKIASHSGKGKEEKVKEIQKGQIRGVKENTPKE
jgi:hypothetical protein